VRLDGDQKTLLYANYYWKHIHAVNQTTSEIQAHRVCLFVVLLLDENLTHSGQISFIRFITLREERLNDGESKKEVSNIYNFKERKESATLTATSTSFTTRSQELPLPSVF
jgi:hypothetical protein